MKKQVIANREKLEIPTYGIGEPEKNPVFFEKRVYQGSSGKVYPVPFVDKVYQDEPPKPVAYDSVRLENDFVKLVMLPEIGGRIFVGQDKKNEDYDFFYRQDVIKPALVGLAGPWISGGVEFNWPQHHRPGTYMPADCFIEEEEDGARTVWLSEHDPINRLKGMHGIRLRPDSSLIELRARLFNRTPMTQTFLWWANIAARVHDNYQSFFPEDVHYVADHAVRAMSSFPCAENDYYGIDYKARAGKNDLSWYKNIPVPTSYMVCDTQFGFFGGYDFDEDGGFVHVANRHISPGKKQWTWGNDEFGWAWDRELTDENGPYVELMAGVYTDNQPDFSYLMPGETKTFSQFWWPYQKVGPVQEANLEAAIRFVVENDRSLDLGLVVSEAMDGLKILLRDNEKVLLEETLESISPESPWQNKELKFSGEDETSLQFLVYKNSGELIIAYRPVCKKSLERKRELATEPPLPQQVESLDELYFIGEHLEQYRHPTRDPEDYWHKILEKDSGDARANLALGRRALARGELDFANEYLKKAMGRWTSMHPNPSTGEAHYYYGLTNKYLGDQDVAYSAFYKATWNYEWKSASFYELACLDCCKKSWKAALEHLNESLLTNAENNKALVLRSLVYLELGNSSLAEKELDTLLKRDPLDHWAQSVKCALSGNTKDFLELSRNDAQTILDVVFEYTAAGFYQNAITLIELHESNDVTPVEVPNPLERNSMTHLVLSWLYEQQGSSEKSIVLLEEASALSSDYLFPSRIQEQIVLEWVVKNKIPCANACYGLGNYYYDKRSYQRAIEMWEKSVAIQADFATVYRNLGIAYWNFLKDGIKAKRAYESAIEKDAQDSRILFEYDQLRKKMGDLEEDRLLYMKERKNLALERDDSSVELAALYNDCGFYEDALELLNGRSFHPWEGGEGKVLKQFTRAHLAIGIAQLEDGNPQSALQHFNSAMDTPDHLGEKYHPLQAKADVLYWQGRALKAIGNEEEARVCFEQSANEAGDFQSMAVTEFSELSYYRGLSLIELGQRSEAEELFLSFKDYAVKLGESEAKIDYFATSLPNLLVFDEDIQLEQEKESQKLLNLALEGMRNLELIA